MERMVKDGSSDAARFLLAQYGKDTLSYFALHDKKRFFFSSTGRSFLSYTILYKVVLVSGDPIGPSDDIPLLLKEFSFFTKGMGLKSCFLAVNAATLPLLAHYGHKKFHIGNEAIVPLSSFEKSALKKKLRKTDRHIQKLGIDCAFYRPDTIPSDYAKQLDAISKEWLLKKGRKEKGFSMTLGRLPTPSDHECRLVLAIKNRDVVGFLTFVPAKAANVLSLDSMRRKQDAPNGLIEFLLIQSLTQFKLEKFSAVSLNFATFQTTAMKRHLSPKTVSKELLFTMLREWYKTNQLYRFNNKFQPQWQERYVTFESMRYLPFYVAAIAGAER